VTKTILIVDDEPDIAEILSDLLGDAGYRSVVARHGGECLVRLDEQHIDLLLLDVMMPIMSGGDVLDELERRGRLRSVPVVLMSAGHSSALAERYGVPFLRKPTSIDTLLRTIRRALGEAEGATPGPSSACDKG
jgi:CheY-like chemotaxis protein